MNNTTQAFIEYVSQFVITDLSRLLIIIGGITIITLFVCWYYGTFRTI
jgi:hypothetical protein